LVAPDEDSKSRHGLQASGGGTKMNRHASDGALNQSFQLEGFYGLTTSNHQHSPGITSAKGKSAVIEALSSLVVAASNRTQEISGEFYLAYRFLQPLDEQIQ
jgi:N-acetyl-gamma-glutamylphosphate reductase